MDHKFYCCPPMAGTHEGWLVDGERIRLAFPAAFYAGYKLTVTFGYRPTRVHALISATVNGRFTTFTQPATYEGS